jgi:hypothetical protein
MVPGWLLLTIWFIAGIAATGSFWYFLGVRNAIGAIGSACIAIIAVILAIALQIRNDRLWKTGLAKGSLDVQLLSFIWRYPLMGENERSWAVKESAILNGDLGTAREKPSLGVAIVTTELASIAFGAAASDRINLCIAWALTHAQHEEPYQMLDAGRDWIHYEELDLKPDFRHTLAFAVILARTRKQHDVLMAHLRLALRRQNEDGGWPADSVRTISPVFTAFYGIELLHLAMSAPRIPSNIRKQLPKRIAKATTWLMNHRESDGLWASGVFPNSRWDHCFASAWVLHRLVPTSTSFARNWHECLEEAAFRMIQQALESETWVGSSEAQRQRVEARIAAAARRVLQMPKVSTRSLDAIDVYLHSWKQRVTDWIERVGMAEIDVGTAAFLAFALIPENRLAAAGEQIILQKAGQ